MAKNRNKHIYTWILKFDRIVITISLCDQAFYNWFFWIQVIFNFQNSTMLFNFLNFDDNLTILNQMAKLLFNCNYSLRSSIFTLSFGKNKL